ncbi:uncharacterized protein LOC113307565 [Papaver somniferum]|uniref:uncharacterized protein LOC113307565 n=1 Tax=Papaver somniferum TaxID=3469 RepID=UPI000E6F7A76|nr:uncharacterized protein LOC113307565 [Papaver somniferum]
MEQKCTLQHFTHSHILYREVTNHYGNLTKEGNPSDEFMCDACYTLGSGARFHCKQCSFDLHEECASCPEYLNTYIHPNHQLELRWEGSSKKDYGKLRPCDICGDQVKGLFYTCSSGAEKRYDDGRHFFFIHPLCSKFPPRVPHGIDKNHPLRFQLVPVIPDSFCAICGDVVFSCSWSYRCDPCGVNIHLECVALPFDDHRHSGTTYSSRSLKDPQAQMHQQKGPIDPPYGGYTGAIPVTAPPYNNYYPPTPPSYNYYPPPNDTYYYQQPPQLYGHPPTPPPPYYNHHQPHAPPKTEATSSSGDTAPPKKETTSSTHGSKKKRSAKVIGRIAVSLLLSSVLGVVVPMGTTG